MIRIASLAAALFVFWLLLSGHYDSFLVGAGLIASVAIAWIGQRMGFSDDEGHPAELILPGFLYWPWLIKEIAKSSVSVGRIVLSPTLPISPRLVEVQPSQTTVVGAVTYANSITLTPGTITVDVDHRDRRFLVHALTEAGATDLAGGDMDRRVTAFEGKR